MANHDQDDPQRWVWRGLAAIVVVFGWLFILWQNSFHITPPTVFLCLAYFALVGVIYNLFRTGASAAKAPDASDEIDDSTWGKPIGAIGELEREKKTLLKAIKEAEFDREMGKLSPEDAGHMIAQYRARAIEVIKEIERLAGANAGLTKREQIEREIRARMELEVKPKKAAKQKKEARDKRKAGKKATAVDPGETRDADDVEADDATGAADGSRSEMAAAADSSAAIGQMGSPASPAPSAQSSDAPQSDASPDAKTDGAKADVAATVEASPPAGAKTDVPKSDSGATKIDAAKSDAAKSSKATAEPDDVKAEVGT